MDFVHIGQMLKFTLTSLNNIFPPKKITRTLGFGVGVFCRDVWCYQLVAKRFSWCSRSWI